jgi:DNA-binding NtrC family response regulator
MGQASTSDPQTARRVVLVVDDDPDLLLLATSLFHEVGLEAIAAQGGTEAWTILERRSDIALLFTDCRMPDISGPDLARAAIMRWPDLRVVLVTGFQDRLMPDWPMVWKPYSVQTITRVVDKVLPEKLNR